MTLSQQGVSGMELHTMPSGDVVAFDEAKHRYYHLRDSDVVPLESVTQTLGVCPKPGLPWWGMTIGVAGALKLAELGELEREVDGERRPIDVEDAVDLLTFHKITVNHVRDDAGLRGDEAHNVGEALANGTLPDPDSVTPEHRGYVEALIAGWLDLAPEPELAEVVVCSPTHGVAGKFDLRCRIPEGRTAVTDAESGWRETIPAGTWIIDYKTPKAVYDSHLLQLAAYEGLSVESGYEPTDHQGVLRLLPDGRYEFVQSWATFSGYLSAVRFFGTLEALKAEAPKRPRKCQRGEHHFIPDGRERICEVCR